MKTMQKTPPKGTPDEHDASASQPTSPAATPAEPHSATAERPPLAPHAEDFGLRERRGTVHGASSVAQRVRADESPRRATFLKSFVYAFEGFLYVVRTQRNARVHLAVAIFAIAMGLVLRISPVEWALIFVAITGVFIGEMLNTVTEAIVDLVTQEHHPLAKVAKDVAAGAVLVNAVLSVIIGLFVFGPHLLTLLGQWLTR